MTQSPSRVHGHPLAGLPAPHSMKRRRYVSVATPLAVVAAVLAAFISPALLPCSASAQTVRITSVVPGEIPNTGEVKLSVYGSGFDPAIEGRLVLGTPAAQLLPISLDWHSQGFLEITFRLVNEQPGHWTLLLTNPGGIVTSWLVKVNAMPMPNGVQPTSAGDGDVLSITVTGAGFYKSKIRLQRSGGGSFPGIGPVTAPNGQSVVATFDLRGAGLGPWDLDVTNGTGLREQLLNAFQVVPGPNIASASPVSAPDTGPVLVTLQGIRFEDGATARLRAAGHPDVTATGVSVALGGTSLQASFNLDGVAAVPYDIVVVNPSGIRAVTPGGFEVLRAPRVIGFEPPVGDDGALVDLVFDGHGFLPGATVRMTRAGEPDLVASPVQVAADGDELTARFDLRDKALGAWDVTVTNANGTSTTPGAFEIRGGPRATAASPGSGEQGSSVTLHVEGGPFASDATLSLERGVASVPATSVEVAAGGGSVTGQVSLVGVDTGAWDVVVRNIGDGAATIPAGFDVHRLRIDSNTPTLAGDGGTVVVLATGERFRAGASASLLRGGVTIQGTDAAASADGRMVAATFDLTGAAHGAWDLAVRNPVGSADTLPGAVNVEAGPPIAAFGLEQAWGGCIGDDSAESDLTTACEPNSTGKLFATFRPPHDYAGFVAMDVVIDVIASGDSIPPFWRFVDGECHANGLDIHDAPPAGLCSSLDSPWGEDGGPADPFITAYAPGHGDRPDRARLLISVVRASSDPVTLIGGQNYYAFHLDLLPGPPGCEGCASQVDWHWVSATFYSITNPEPMVIRNPGLRTKTVTVNGGISGPTVSSVWPERVTASAGVELEVYGHDFWPGAQVHLVRGPGDEILASESQVSPNGQTLRATFDLSGQAAGVLDLVVTNPDKSRGMLTKGLQVDAVTSTLVLAFDARPVLEGIEIRWRLARPAEWARTWVERGATESGPWRELAEAVTSGDESVVHDAEPLGVNAPWYRLMGERPGQTAVDLGTIRLPVASPGVTRLDEVAPNPSSGPLRIAYSLDRPQPVRISILDVQGRVLAVLVDGPRAAGSHAAHWAGDTPNGTARPGIYFVEARLGTRTQQRRVAIVR